jgi:hypothetical protein
MKKDSTGITIGPDIGISEVPELSAHLDKGKVYLNWFCLGILLARPYGILEVSHEAH